MPSTLEHEASFIQRGISPEHPSCLDRFYTHDAMVHRVARQVRTFFENHEPFRIFHGSSYSTRSPSLSASVDISSLSDVLHVSTAEKYALVEPNVPMDRLVESTIAVGLVPLVVIGFPGVTVGGGFSSSSCESSSFRHGLFSETVTQIEMILGNGQVVSASKTELPDLFHGAAGALGTLGIITLAKVALAEANKFVRVQYLRLGSIPDTVCRLEDMTRTSDAAYLDSIVFSSTHSVIISGHPCNELPQGATIQKFSHKSDPWFYLHVRERMEGQPVEALCEEYVPLTDYLFRYDRGAFWIFEQAETYFKNVPFKGFFRWLLGDLFHANALFYALRFFGLGSRLVIQDVVIAYQNAEALMSYIASEFNTLSKWLCPLAPGALPSLNPFILKAGLSLTAAVSQPMLNIGFGGLSPLGKTNFIAANRRLETMLRKLQGRKWLYAYVSYTEKEFWEDYDRGWYDALRAKYYANRLPSVYDKVRP